MRGWISKKQTLLPLVCLSLPLFFTLVGCRSRYVQTTLVNEGATTLQNVEVDYPSASFGLASLPPGGSFSYRFQIQGSGDLQLLYVDSAQHAHSETGPYVTEGQEGTLRIALGGADKSHWQLQVTPNTTVPN